MHWVDYASPTRQGIESVRAWSRSGFSNSEQARIGHRQEVDKARLGVL